MISQKISFEQVDLRRAARQYGAGLPERLDVVHLGLASTDLLFFAAGHFDAPGAMLTASHNPADDNGLKVLDSRGLKLDDPAEDALERLVWRTELRRPG